MNGRLAMIGFTAALANEAITGASLWQQLYFAPYAYLSAYLLVVAAAQLNRAFGSPNKGESAAESAVLPFLWIVTALPSANTHMRSEQPCLLAYTNSVADADDKWTLHTCVPAFGLHAVWSTVSHRKAPATCMFLIKLTLNKQNTVAKSML